jgi:hypothetical protein
MNNPVARISLGPNFKITFNLLLSSLASSGQVRNILDLRDASDGTRLFRIGITDQRNTRTEYAGVVYHTYGPTVVNSYTSSYTTITFTHNAGVITTYSTGDTYTDTFTVTGGSIDTTGKSYTLSLSGPDDGTNPSAAGEVTVLSIARKSLCFSFYLLRLEFLNFLLGILPCNSPHGATHGCAKSCAHRRTHAQSHGRANVCTYGL